jgi:hypothetical protein
MVEVIDPRANGERLPHPLMMPGNTAATRVLLIVRCRECQHQVKPDPAEMAARCGAGTSRLARQVGLLTLRQPAQVLKIGTGLSAASGG